MPFINIPGPRHREVPRLVGVVGGEWCAIAIQRHRDLSAARPRVLGGGGALLGRAARLEQRGMRRCWGLQAIPKPAACSVEQLRRNKTNATQTSTETDLPPSDSPLEGSATACSPGARGHVEAARIPFGDAAPRATRPGPDSTTAGCERNASMPHSEGSRCSGSTSDLG